MNYSISSTVPPNDKRTAIPMSRGNLSISLDHAPFLEYGLWRILVFIFVFGLQIPVLAFGIGTNVLNILIFRMSGQKDGISMAFMALSISDLGYTTFFFTVRIIGLLFMFDVKSRIRLGYLGLSHYVVYYSIMFQDLSVVITVFLAVQKCCCVAIPHIFKNVFSPRNATVILVCLSVIVVALYIPILSTMSFTTISLPPFFNETIITLREIPIVSGAITFWRVFNKIILPVSSQIISYICLIVMVIQLKTSAKFRSATAEIGVDKKTSSTLGFKERRAVTAVALVLGLFVVTTTPATILSIAYNTVLKNIFDQPRYSSFRLLIDNCQNLLINASAAINTFVYLKYNTKFKETTVGLFHRCSCARDEQNTPSE